MSAKPCQLHTNALLSACRAEGAYVDCYCIDSPWRVSQAEYVEAFYTTAVFRVERLVLRWVLSKPSSDRDARLLAEGARETFAVWQVEARDADQLLLADVTGRTKSWLMSAPVGDGHGNATRLYFGSAVMPARHRATGERRLGPVFHALLGFHQCYSRVLLTAARARLA